MTLDDRIQGLESIYNNYGSYFDYFDILAICEQIKLLKAEKQRIENYELIKDEIIK